MNIIIWKYNQCCSFNNHQSNGTLHNIHKYLQNENMKHFKTKIDKANNGHFINFIGFLMLGCFNLEKRVKGFSRIVIKLDLSAFIKIKLFFPIERDFWRFPFVFHFSSHWVFVKLTFKIINEMQFGFFIILWKVKRMNRNHFNITFIQ